MYAINLIVHLWCNATASERRALRSTLTSAQQGADRALQRELSRCVDTLDRLENYGAVAPDDNELAPVWWRYADTSVCEGAD